MTIDIHIGSGRSCLMGRIYLDRYSKNQDGSKGAASARAMVKCKRMMGMIATTSTH